MRKPAGGHVWCTANSFPPTLNKSGEEEYSFVTRILRRVASGSFPAHRLRRSPFRRDSSCQKLIMQIVCRVLSFSHRKLQGHANDDPRSSAAWSYSSSSTDNFDWPVGAGGDILSMLNQDEGQNGRKARRTRNAHGQERQPASWSQDLAISVFEYQAHRETEGSVTPFRSRRGTNGGWHCR